MLKARFEYAGSWRRGPEVWFGVAEMADYLKRKAIRVNHRALREHFEASAPMLFADDQLSLFGASDEPSQDLTYLVWTADKNEPEIWVYEGYDSCKFMDLEEYLRWRLERP